MSSQIGSQANLLLYWTVKCEHLASGNYSSYTPAARSQDSKKVLARIFLSTKYSSTTMIQKSRHPNLSPNYEKISTEDEQEDGNKPEHVSFALKINSMFYLLA